MIEKKTDFSINVHHVLLIEEFDLIRWHEHYNIYLSWKLREPTKRKEEMILL